MTKQALTRVLYAHPDRWTIGAEFPPEECERMRLALTGFTVEWLAWQSPARLEHDGRMVEDSEPQRRALEKWREQQKAFGKRARRIGKGRFDARPLVEAAVEAVVSGALWDSPVFRSTDSTLEFHRAWRLVVRLPAANEHAVPALAARWKLLVRNR